MTDQPVPSPVTSPSGPPFMSPDAPDAAAPEGAPPDAATPPPAAPPPAAPPPAPAKQPGKWRIIVIIAILGGFLGAVLWAVRDSQLADDLVAGHCFDQPTDSTEFSTVTRRECTVAHDAEVFHVAEYDGESYPISLSLERFISEQCIPAFEAYVGAPFETTLEYEIGWFYPTRASWDDGDRTVICYVYPADEMKLIQSVKGAGGA